MILEFGIAAIIVSAGYKMHGKVKVAKLNKNERKRKFYLKEIFENVDKKVKDGTVKHYDFDREFSKQVLNKAKEYPDIFHKEIEAIYKKGIHKEFKAPEKKKEKVFKPVSYVKEFDLHKRKEKEKIYDK